MKTIGIEGEKHLIRDLHSKAILSTDKSSLEQYKAHRGIMTKNMRLEQQVQDLHNEMQEIKNLLRHLIESK